MTREISFAYLSRLRATLLRGREEGGEREKEGAATTTRITLARAFFTSVIGRPYVSREVCACAYVLRNYLRRRKYRAKKADYVHPRRAISRVVPRAWKPRPGLGIRYYDANERIIETRSHVSVLVIARSNGEKLMERRAFIRFRAEIKDFHGKFQGIIR